MGNAQTKKEYFDYYTANKDWAGNRTINNTQEIVQYHNNSTVRIWCNEQNSDYTRRIHGRFF